MQINFTSHNVEITPALRSFTLEKFNRLERHFDKITSVAVKFDIEKLSQIAEASIQIPRAKLLHARAESESLYTSIDNLVDKLDEKLIRHKEKIRDHRRVEE